MKSSIFFTIVIPTFNRSTFLPKAIQSVLTQRFTEFELWVIDDGSTDDTEERVSKITDPRLHYTKIQNSERGAARNVGIQKSMGRYVTFLDSDDFFYPCHLEIVYAQLLKLHLPEVYHQAYHVVNEEGTVLKDPKRRVDLRKALFEEGNVMSCIGVFVRRDISITNLFQENRTLAGLEDWELWIRLAIQFPIHYNARPTSALLSHAGRGSREIDPRRLEQNCQIFLKLTSEILCSRKYQKYLRSLKANVYTFMSLHLSENKSQKLASWNYLLRGIREKRSQIVRKRTLAILRNVMFS